jgi:hypothetical protein
MPMHDGTTKLLKDIVVGDVLTGYYMEGMIDGDVPGWNNWTTTSPTEGFMIPITVTEVRTAEYENFYYINSDIKITREHSLFASKDGIT